MNEEAYLRMKQTRSVMLVESGFYGELAYRLILKEDLMLDIPEHKRTIWTDGVTLGYNPEYVMKASQSLLLFSMKHEVEHCGLLHQLRRDGRDPEEWNIACDYAVNAILKNAGEKLPDWVLYDPKFENKPAEEIYKILKGKKQEQEEQQEEKGDEGNGDSEGEGLGDCPGGCGEIRDFPGSGEENGDVQTAHEQEWMEAAAIAAQHAESVGQMPGYIKQVIEEMVSSKVPWQEVLMRWVTEKSKNDYSWSKSNTRYAHTGFVLPSLADEQLPPIGFAIDTSGSISPDDLIQFASEGEEILAQFPTTLIVVQADTEVRHTQECSREDIPLKLEMHGGGGTAFADTFRWFNEQDVQPIGVVYLTDLYCRQEDFGPEPDYPVLWIQTEGPQQKVPWGEVVRMKKRF